MVISGAADSLSPTVLIVDDSEMCVILLETAFLRIPGVEVNCASSGSQALQLLVAPGTRLHALVTDLNMPSLDGFELIARVRADQRYADLPIIVVSGDTDPGTPERVTRLGANAFFAKPFSPAVVSRTLETLLHGGGAKN